MHVIACTQQFFQIHCCFFFRKNLIFLFCDFLKQLAAAHIFHDKIDIFLIYVRLVIPDYVWMVQLGQDVYFFLDCLKMVLKLCFVHNFDCHLMVLIVLVECLENFAESARAQNYCAVIDLIILFQFFGPLLLLGFERNRFFVRRDRVTFRT